MLHICPPHPSGVATVPWEMQKKVIFNSIIHTLDTLRCVAFFQTLEVLKRASCGLSVALKKKPVVMCGNWNVRQAMSQQVFRVTTFCFKT